MLTKNISSSNIYSSLHFLLCHYLDTSCSSECVTVSEAFKHINCYLLTSPKLKTRCPQCHITDPHLWMSFMKLHLHLQKVNKHSSRTWMKNVQFLLNNAESVSQEVSDSWEEPESSDGRVGQLTGPELDLWAWTGPRGHACAGGAFWSVFNKVIWLIMRLLCS